MDLGTTGTADYYEPVVISATDYFPFGMDMPGRTYQAGDYRFGFNGKEKDQNEEWGDLTHYDYGFRIYNPGIARFLSVDPLTKEYPSWTPYAFAMNRVIDGVDLDGLEWEWYVNAKMGILGETTQKIVNGAESGVAESAKGTWNFITKDAWKSSTWKEAGLFIEELAFGPSTVPVIETPRLDAAVQQFEDDVIDGDAYTRSKFVSKMATDIATGIIADKGTSKLKGFIQSGTILSRSFPGSPRSGTLGMNSIWKFSGGSWRYGKTGNFKFSHTVSEIEKSSTWKNLSKLSDDDLLKTLDANNPDWEPIQIKRGQIYRGNNRIYEIRRRGLEPDIDYFEYRDDLSDYFYDLDPSFKGN